jgi:hypothetical protein
MSSSIIDAMFEDTTADIELTVSDSALGKLSALANKQLEIERWIEAQQERLKLATDALRRVREVELPEALDEAGVSKFTLSDGSTVSVSPYYSASIPADRKAEAFQWLDRNGFGDLIKTEVVTRFGRGEIDQARELSRNLKDQGYEAENKDSVHAQTLKAFIREQIESGGVAVPLDLFGAYVGRQTVIKKGK